MMRMLVTLLLLSPGAFAVEVLKVKGQKALISAEGDLVAAGQTYFAVEGGKKKALIQIVKLKGDKAIGKILKGNASPGMKMELQSGGGSETRASRPGRRRESRDSEPRHSRAYWGAIFGYAMDSMSVNIYSTGASRNLLGKTDMTGSGFAAAALFDYEVFPQVWFRGTAGMEQFNTASNDTSCGTANNEACKANIMYLGANLVGRYVFSNGKIRPWGGLGLTLLFPSSKTSTALDQSSIGTTNAITPQAGIDFFVSPTMYIPLSAEYGLMPDSTDVKAHWIAFRAGFAVPF